MKWASSLSREPDFEAASAVALDGLAGQIPAPDLVLAFVSPHHAASWNELPEKVAARFPGAHLLGCSANGVIGAGHEVEGEPALALTAASLPGVEVTPFHLAAGESPAVVAAKDPQFVLLADPFTFDTDRLVRGMDERFPAAVKVGGLASGGRRPGANALFLDGKCHGDGCVGVGLSGNLTVDTLVAQGCRPIGSPMFATRVQRNLLFQLDGRPAAKVLEGIFVTLDEADRALFRQALFLGVVMKEGSSVYRQGDFLIRNLVGVDPDAGALAVGAILDDNAVVQFHLRDAKTSSADLHALLSRYQEDGRESPAGGLLFSCLGRGEGLYGSPDHDTLALQAHLGALPVGGFFCNGEIGPVGGKTFLHGYTSSIGLFRPKA